MGEAAETSSWSLSAALETGRNLAGCLSKSEIKAATVYISPLYRHVPTIQSSHENHTQRTFCGY